MDAGRWDPTHEKGYCAAEVLDEIKRNRREVQKAVKRTANTDYLVEG